MLLYSDIREINGGVRDDEGLLIVVDGKVTQTLSLAKLRVMRGMGEGPLYAVEARRGSVNFAVTFLATPPSDPYRPHTLRPTPPDSFAGNKGQAPPSG
jgi:hypothetical protein